MRVATSDGLQINSFMEHSTQSKSMASCSSRSVSRARATKSWQGAVSPEMVTEPSAVSKRKAKAGAMGGCLTSVAVTVTSSSR